MLGSASGSLANYPGHPPAAPGRLLSLVPDLVLGPRELLDSGELQQPGRRGTTRFFGTRPKVYIGWAASASKPARRSFHRTSRTAIHSDTAVMSTPQGLCHAVGAWPSGSAHARTTVFNSQVWSLSSVYRKKVYSSVFTHTLSSHLALGRRPHTRGPDGNLAPCSV